MSHLKCFIFVLFFSKSLKSTTASIYGDDQPFALPPTSITVNLPSDFFLIYIQLPHFYLHLII
jgi:hypothetical protein